MSRPVAALAALLVSSLTIAAGQQKQAPGATTVTLPAPPPPASVPERPQVRPPDLDRRQPLSKNTQYELIKAVNAEFARTRYTLPLGEKDLVITADGKVKPDETSLYKTAMTHGGSAKIGDRVQITDIKFKDKEIVLDLNGGAKKKGGHWYNHISVGMGTGNAGVTTPDQEQKGPTGAVLTLEFKNHVPEMTGQELRDLLGPVLDFSVHSASQVYLESLPPMVQKAIKTHDVLVGMNHDMVLLAKDRPGQKVREKDEQGRPYEDWIYGAPPQDVTFVRFIGDEVTMVKIVKVGAPMVVKTQKEVDLGDGAPTVASASGQSRVPGAQSDDEESQSPPTNRPTLRKPGEEPDPDSPQGQRTGTPVPSNDPDRDTSTPPPQLPPSGQRPPR